MLVRIYNKTEQIKKKHIEWIASVWRNNETYKEGFPVWRIEVQIRREILRELGIETIDEALASLKGLWNFGLTWLELRKPSSNKQKARWKIDKRWIELKENAYFEGKPCERVRRAKRKADERRIVIMLGGYLTRLAAMYGDHSIKAAITRAGVEYGHYLNERGLDFRDVVQSKIEKQEDDLPF